MTSPAVCPSCGGPLTTENFVEATITTGPCGYSWASHFGGGEAREKPCSGRDFVTPGKAPLPTRRQRAGAAIASRKEPFSFRYRVAA